MLTATHHSRGDGSIYVKGLEIAIQKAQENKGFTSVKIDFVL
jgi:hypothetical protein